MDRIVVDENGYVWVDKLKICRLTNWGCVEFFDRDKRRANYRGSHFVYADLEQLISILESCRQAGKE